MDTQPAKRPVNLESSRDMPVDVLRGGAIALMVMANMAPALLQPPAPGWFRFLATLAAPVFVILSGMMVALSRSGKGRTLGYIARRGGMVLLLAMFLDAAAGGIIPFTDMDVLYLIGISLPIAYLYLGLPEERRRLVIPGILILTPVFQVILGYSPEVYLVLLSEASFAGISAVPPALLSVCTSFLVDGWFPVFPWLAFSLFGAELGCYRWGKNPRKSFRFSREGLAGLGLLAGGGLIWLLQPGPGYMRMGYVELFYPPTVGFCLFMSGVLVLGLSVLDTAGSLRPLGILRVLGECSLAIYVIHILVISWIIRPVHAVLPLPEYLVVFLGFLSALVALAFLLRHIRKTRKNLPSLLRFFIG